MDLDDTVVLANFRALDLRLGHMMDICAAYEQLAWYQASHSLELNQN